MADLEPGVEAALYRVLERNRYRLGAVLNQPDDETVATALRNVAGELHEAIAAALAIPPAGVLEVWVCGAFGDAPGPCYRCTLPAGHGGDEHEARSPDGDVLARWPRRAT